MSVTNIQERVERSIFTLIEAMGVQLGYCVDRNAILALPITDAAKEVTYENAVAAIVGSKGFAVEVFNVGGSRSKNAKKTPRIVMISRRFLDGEVGNIPVPIYQGDPLHPGILQSVLGILQTTNYHVDINLVSASAAQDRVLNQIVSGALGVKKFIPMFDTQELFLIKQYNYYDLPDSEDGLVDKVYSYEVPDIYMGEDIIVNPNVPKILEINVDIIGKASSNPIDLEDTKLGPGDSKESMHIE